MEERKDILIIGPAASGKTTRAKQEAEKRGIYTITYMETLQRYSTLKYIVSFNPATVIVEGLQCRRKEIEFLKSLLDGDVLEVRGKSFQMPRDKRPLFIFTVLTPLRPQAVLQEHDIRFSRFEVIRLDA